MPSGESATNGTLGIKSTNTCYPCLTIRTPDLTIAHAGSLLLDIHSWFIASTVRAVVDQVETC